MLKLLTSDEVAEKVIAIVHRAIDRHGLSDLRRGTDACARLGLTVARAPLAAGVEGCLVFEQRLVCLNSNEMWTTREQFTIFHEITHFLLEDDGELIEYFAATLGTDKSRYKLEIERCCNMGAAEFMIPRRRVREAIAADGLSVQLIPMLAGQCGCSMVAAAFQVADCAQERCYVAICTYGCPPGAAQRGLRLFPDRGHAALEQLYLEHTARSPSTRYPLARYASVPEDHLFASVWSEGGEAAADTFVPFPSGRRQSCFGRAMRLNQRVIGLLLLERPVPKAQMVLQFG